MLKKIFKTLFGGGPSSKGADGFFLQVRCDRCSEAFRLFINKSTDLSQDFDENENVYYKLKKEIIGASCRNLIHVEMIFDSSKNLVSKQIENGSYIDET